MDDKSKQRQLAVQIAEQSSEAEREVLLTWANGLLEIREKSLPAGLKAKEAVDLTLKSKVVTPAFKLIGREMKRLAWDDRGTKSRLAIIGATVGLTVFGGQGAGIAALGGAIGVPLWVVLGAGGAFAGMLIEELQKARGSKTEYTVIDAERVDHDK
jgi:hypothetical protein